MADRKTIIDVTHVSTRTGNSYRITLPKKVVEIMGLTVDDNILVFTHEDGRIMLEKLPGE
jgi:bifunctional DNA-binding transcriptional regulator/antitoxin component of YhaV-PrlF toxin-antitoxin module